MVKRIGLALLIAAVAATGVFALDLSAGIGGTFRGNFNQAAWTQDGKDMLDAAKMDEDIFNSNLFGGGFFAYFDATYVAVSLGMGILDESPANADVKKLYDDAKTSYTFTTFDIGLLGKFPIDLGGFTLFPAAGVNFRIPLDYVQTVDGKDYKWADEYDDESIIEWMTEIWFNFGAGADIPLGDQLYLRAMFLYGFGTLSKADKEQQDERNKPKALYSQINHGFDFNLAVGFKF
ncbi:MAG: hypothetical protein LBU66_05785 [Treponema sp.]|jgi:hypothetical protein|nr:hypothetical protein [Treponema sp.]